MYRFCLILIGFYFALKPASAQEWQFFEVDDNEDLWWVYYSHFAIDTGNVVWAGAFGGGISIFENNQWSSFRETPVGSFWGSTQFLDIKFDQNNTAFIISNQGFYIKKDTVWSAPEISIARIAIDKNNQKWFSGQGLVYYNDTNFTVYDQDNSDIPENYTTQIAVDSKGTIYLTPASGNGYIMFKDSTWTVFTDTNSGLPYRNINSFAVDQNDHLWIAHGQPGEGLTKFDGENWTHFNTSNSDIPGTYISSVTVDHNNDIWLGGLQDSLYKSIGAAKYDHVQFVHFHRDNIPGYPLSGGSGSLTSITVDKVNHKWMSTGGCIFVYREGGIEVNVKKMMEARGFKVYPNPASDKVQAELEFDKPGRVKLTLLNNMGSTVLQKEEEGFAGENTFSLQTGGLTTGLYILKIESSNGTAFKKILIR